MGRKVLVPEFDEQQEIHFTEAFLKHFETGIVLALKEMRYLDHDEAVYILEELNKAERQRKEKE